MAYAEDDFKEAVLATLRADAVLMSLCPYIWPSEHLGGEMPYARWGVDQIIEDGADCVDGLQYAFQLDVFARKKTEPACLRIASRIRKILHNREVLVGSGMDTFGLLCITHETTRRFTDEDTTVDHAVVEFIGLIDAT